MAKYSLLLVNPTDPTMFLGPAIDSDVYPAKDDLHLVSGQHYKVTLVVEIPDTLSPKEFHLRVKPMSYPKGGTVRTGLR